MTHTTYKKFMPNTTFQPNQIKTSIPFAADELYILYCMETNKLVTYEIIYRVQVFFAYQQD
jgi:hypothetical protein